MGRTDDGAKRPVTRRSRLLVVRCARCGVLSHRSEDGCGIRRFRRFNHSMCKTVLDTATLVRFWCPPTAVFTAAIALCIIYRHCIPCTSTDSRRHYAFLYSRKLPIVTHFSPAVYFPLWYQCILQPPVFYTVLGGFTYR